MGMQLDFWACNCFGSDDVPQTPANKTFGHATALAVMMFQPQQKYRKEMQEIDRYTLDVFNSFFSYKRFL